MRARTIIRQMEEGDPEAWNKAELKLSQSDVKGPNKEALRDAMRRLIDPRKTDEAAPDDR